MNLNINTPSQTNIHAGNKYLRYSPDNDKPWFNVTLCTGSCGIDEFDEIQRQLQLNKYKTKIVFDANRATLSATLPLAFNCQGYFDVDNSLNIF